MALVYTIFPTTKNSLPNTNYWKFSQISTFSAELKSPRTRICGHLRTSPVQCRSHTPHSEFRSSSIAGKRESFQETFLRCPGSVHCTGSKLSARVNWVDQEFDSFLCPERHSLLGLLKPGGDFRPTLWTHFRN